MGNGRLLTNTKKLKPAFLEQTLSFQEKYDAIGKENTHFEGVFFTAVKTTGIFCRPTCRARKPKIENVIFYDTTQEALQNGYRPCKVCKPMEPLNETPGEIKRLIKDLHQNPDLRITDQDLRTRGIVPSQIRRWFKSHHHMTFQTYQRMLRLNSVFTRIQSGEGITASAFESGYESLSTFNESYRTVFGEPPSKTRQKSVLNFLRFTTPLGTMFACASNRGLCLLEFTDRKILETELKDLCKQLKAIMLPGENPYLTRVQQEIQTYFSGLLKNFTVPLHLSGTAFQKSVWQKLQEIPYGKTHSYKKQAIALGKPKAIRAVASANGHNRIGIIIPCHRIVGSDGSLKGYGGGLHRKQWLLDFEKKQSEGSTT
ncbi:MAG: methylated-DNA--[protein]-cysteine S-methyltransferase [Nitrospirae bacterium]|nr:methylated-DNA--[protein]-cysteine S-methyltransferase [Candidatus Manganitrophaceae bacterium]